MAKFSKKQNEEKIEEDVKTLSLDEISTDVQNEKVEDTNVEVIEQNEKNEEKIEEIIEDQKEEKTTKTSNPQKLIDFLF